MLLSSRIIHAPQRREKYEYRNTSYRTRRVLASRRARCSVASPLVDPRFPSSRPIRSFRYRHLHRRILGYRECDQGDLNPNHLAVANERGDLLRLSVRQAAPHLAFLCWLRVPGHSLESLQAPRAEDARLLLWLRRSLDCVYHCLAEGLVERSLPHDCSLAVTPLRVRSDLRLGKRIWQRR